jgi:ATP-dependent DNA ligase
MSKRVGIQLAYPLEEKRILKWKPPYICQPKLDGIRCRAIRHGNSYILLSSEENVIFLPHIVEALNLLPMDELYGYHEYDGELYVHGWPLEQINGTIPRPDTVNFNPNAGKIQFHIFDIIKEDQPQYLRIHNLMQLNLYDPLILCKPSICNTMQEIIETYNAFLSEGYEGIIVRHFAAGYVRKRSTYILKFKPKKEDTYLIVSWEEEKSVDKVPKGTLGALVCWDGTNHFSVGSGLTNQLRRELWEVRDELPGKYVKIGYQHLTTTNKVPRFPIFLEIVERGE